MRWVLSRPTPSAFAGRRSGAACENPRVSRGLCRLASAFSRALWVRGARRWRSRRPRLVAQAGRVLPVRPACLEAAPGLHGAVLEPPCTRDLGWVHSTTCCPPRCPEVATAWVPPSGPPPGSLLSGRLLWGLARLGPRPRASPLPPPPPVPCQARGLHACMPRGPRSGSRSGSIRAHGSGAGAGGVRATTIRDKD